MMMMTPTWTILVLLLVFTSIMAENINSDDNQKFLRKREVDSGFMRRYNHLHNEYKDNPFAFSFLKYFLRNRGQKRERRQIDNRYYSNGYNPAQVSAPARYNANNNNYNAGTIKLKD